MIKAKASETPGSTLIKAARAIKIAEAMMAFCGTLWRVSGRSEIKDFDEVVKLDVAYIDDWTIWKDIEILLKTVKVVFMRDGAK